MSLADELIKKGVLKNKRLIEVFRAVDRKNFVPENLREFAYIDDPLPIGEGQTISQPWTVAFMLELLDPRPGENIMEIGYGSGWQTALLAASGANVYAIERVPELCKLGKNNVKNFFRKRSNSTPSAPPPLTIRGGGWGEELSQPHVKFFCQDGALGLPEIAKKIGGFDKIIAAAALGAAKIPTHVGIADLLPEAWKMQLKTGGKIVTPIEHSIFEFIKEPAGNFKNIEHPGFAFVPLISNENGRISRD